MTMHIRRLWLIPVLATAAMATPAGVHAQDAAALRDMRTLVRYQGNRDQDRVSETDTKVHIIKVGAAGSVDLRNIAGDMTVTAGSGDTARIEVIRVARGTNSADARELLSLVTVDVVERSGRVEVSTRYPDQRSASRRRNLNVSATYRVTVPSGTRIRTESISGDITVSGVRGDLELGTISGDVRVEGAGRTLKAQSISGNVELLSAQDDAAIELSSTSGDVRVRGVRVARLEMKSVSGNVTGHDVNSQYATLGTVSGNVEYGGMLARGGRYEFKSHSGDVRLTVGKSVGFEFEASTFSGEVRSGLPLRLDGQTGGRRHRMVRGTFGDGGARVQASSFSGSIIINGR